MEGHNKVAKPKVSICIPAYSQPDLLRKSLQSVLIQSFKDYEVVITDDSPNDSVERVVREFRPNSKIRYYKNEERKGSPENWNEAINFSTGEYIKILHHDDWFSTEESLSELVKMLDDNPQADFAFCSCLNYSPDGKLLFIHSPTAKQLVALKKNPEYLFPVNMIGAPSETIYRSKVNKKFDSRLKWVVDIDFYIRILESNSNFVFSPKPLVCNTTNYPDRVTVECLGNKSIEIFEWIYLHNKLHKTWIPNINHVRFIWNLLNRHGVDSMDEIVAVGLEPPISKTLRTIVLLLRMKAYLKKWLLKPE